MFRSRGFDQTRVQDVIAAVGVSEPTFFNYFATKEAVLEEFAAQAIDLFIDVLRQELDDESRSTDEKVRRLLASVAFGFTDDREFMTVVVTRSSIFLGAQGAVRDREMVMYDLLTELFARGQQRGEIRPELDPRRIAETFTGAYMLTTGNWLVGWWGDRDELADRLDEQARVLLTGCRTEPPPAR